MTALNYGRAVIEINSAQLTLLSGAGRPPACFAAEWLLVAERTRVSAYSRQAKSVGVKALQRKTASVFYLVPRLKVECSA